MAKFEFYIPTKEQDTERLIESKGCHDCLSWHKHCQAECCRFFSFQKKGATQITGFWIVPAKNLTPDFIWYYRLRGCTYSRGVLRVPEQFVQDRGARMDVIRDCDLLKDNKCTGHPDRKPKLCREFTAEVVLNGGLANTQVTSNCLFRYKAMEATNGQAKREDTQEARREETS